MEKYKTGTGQTIRVHEKKDCEGQNCCIHNPSDHHMVNWPTHWRDDRGLMERICPHGIGHPDPDDIAFKERNDLPDKKGVHGCDGCCNGVQFLAKINKMYKEVIMWEDFLEKIGVKKIDDFEDPDLDNLTKCHIEPDEGWPRE